MGKREPRLHTVTNRYLDDVIEKAGIPSDYALAQILGITPTAIYKMRAGGAMSPKTAVKVAELLELEPLEVIARTQDESDGANDGFWKKYIALFVLAITTGTLPAPAPAAPLCTCSGAPGSCVLCKTRRRFFPTLTGGAA